MQMIYKINAEAISNCYDKNGNSVEIAYDVNGLQVYPDSNALRIMSYNVLRWEGDNSMTSIQDIAFASGADIVGIQEWGTTATKTINGINCVTYLNDKGYGNVYITSGDINHKAIASQYPMTDMTEVVYAQSIETRSYTKSYFQYGGKTIAFFNTHTDYQLNSAVKFAQIAELLDAVENEDYFILTGDLNTTCTDKSATEYLNCVQPFIDAGYNVANSPVGEDLIWTYYNGKTIAESTQITPPDNIITSANINISDVFTIKTKLSSGTNNVIDHLPLVADLIVS